MPQPQPRRAPPKPNLDEIHKWIEKELERQRREGNTKQDFLPFRPLAKEPERAREGMVATADGTNWDPGEGAGTYIHSGGDWTKIRTSDTPVGQSDLDEDSVGTDEIIEDSVTVSAKDYEHGSQALTGTYAAVAETDPAIVVNGKKVKITVSLEAKRDGGGAGATSTFAFKVMRMVGGVGTQVGSEFDDETALADYWQSFGMYVWDNPTAATSCTWRIEAKEADANNTDVRRVWIEAMLCKTEA